MDGAHIRVMVAGCATVQAPVLATRGVGSRATQRMGTSSSRTCRQVRHTWSSGTGKAQIGTAATPPVWTIASRHDGGCASLRASGAPGCQAKIPPVVGQTKTRALGSRRWNHPDHVTASFSAVAEARSTTSGTPPRTFRSVIMRVVVCGAATLRVVGHGDDLPPRAQHGVDGPPVFGGVVVLGAADVAVAPGGGWQGTHEWAIPARIFPARPSPRHPAIVDGRAGQSNRRPAGSGGQSADVTGRRQRGLGE